MTQKDNPSVKSKFYLKPIIDFNNRHASKKPGKFFIISGSSGVGKNTLLNFALEKINGLYYLPSITTRSPREGESQGNPYYFVTVEDFKEMIQAGVFLEWKEIHGGNYYGTHLPTIKYALDNGFKIATDMDVLGCEDAVKTFPKNIVSIFIVPPSLNDLKMRLMERDNDPENIKTRLKRVEMELRYKDYYDHVIINDLLERAGNELVTIIASSSKNN